jgi:ERF superfamily protein
MTQTSLLEIQPPAVDLATTSQGAPPELTAFLEIINTAIANPKINPNKLEKLIEIYEGLMARRAKAEHSVAMTRAQAQMRAVNWDRYNRQTRSHYASYKAIDDEIRPIYTAEGFNMTFDTEPSDKADEILMVCDVSHTGGHERRYRLPMPTDGKGAKGGDVMTKTHATGAATSYGMRYLAKLIWNLPIIVDVDDVDGNNTGQVLTATQLADLQALIDEVKANKVKLLKYLSGQARRELTELDQIPASLYKNAIDALNEKRRTDNGGSK